MIVFGRCVDDSTRHPTKEMFGSTAITDQIYFYPKGLCLPNLHNNWRLYLFVQLKSTEAGHQMFRQHFVGARSLARFRHTTLTPTLLLEDIFK